jgi:alpha-galactosidase
MVPKPVSLLIFAAIPSTNALDNGLAPTPPMGWRNWNAYQGDIDDSVIRMAIDRMTSRKRLVDGMPTSLSDLGYGRVGIDDNWQACGTGYKGSFHAQDGTPLVNASRFPDLKSLVDYGHGKGVKMGWYNVNCICMDTYTIQRDSDQDWAKRVYAAEVQLMRDAGFDGVKVDNCGDDQGIGFVMMNDIINKSGSPMLIENCNQGHSGNPRGLPTDPTQECPGNFFRTGGDIVSDFGVVMDKLQRTTPFQDLQAPISRPDCWAYPDMLEVGNFPGQDMEVQSRTHFGAWCIVSSPLILSFDLADDTVTDAIWPIISNREAIAVNQAWAGHPGRLVLDGGSYQIWAKLLANGEQAAIILNRGNKALESVDVALSDLGIAGPVKVRDIWERKDLSTIQTTWSTGALPAFGSAFVRLTPAAVV